MKTERKPTQNRAQSPLVIAGLAPGGTHGKTVLCLSAAVFEYETPLHVRLGHRDGRFDDAALACVRKRSDTGLIWVARGGWSVVVSVDLLIMGFDCGIDAVCNR